MENITAEYIVTQSKVLSDEELLNLIELYKRQEREDAQNDLYGDFYGNEL